MTWYDDMLWWCAMITCYDDMLWWHAMMLCYDDMIWWHDMMTCYDDMLWCYVMMAWYDDMLWWHAMMTCCERRGGEGGGWVDCAGKKTRTPHLGCREKPRKNIVWPDFDRIAGQVFDQGFWLPNIYSFAGSTGTEKYSCADSTGTKRYSFTALLVVFYGEGILTGARG